MSKVERCRCAANCLWYKCSIGLTGLWSGPNLYSEGPGAMTFMILRRICQYVFVIKVSFEFNPAQLIRSARTDGGAIAL